MGWLEAYGVKVQSVTSNLKACVTEKAKFIQRYKHLSVPTLLFSFSYVCIILWAQGDGEGSEKNH